MVKEIRLNKYLSELGVCSRREADLFIEKGQVTVDNQIAAIGMKVFEGQEIKVNGKIVKGQDKKIIIAFNKPKGIICSSKYDNNIIDYINYPTRIYTIGRLDKNSQGLILLTNNGDIVNKISKASNYHEKEYVVFVNKDITKDFINSMQNGVPILDTITRPCKIIIEGKREFRIILTQGLNRQIRRMCEYFGYKVVKLVRVRIMNIKLGNLKEGTYRNITKEELKELKSQFK